MRFSLKSGFSSCVALVASVACSGSVDTQTGTSRDRDSGSAGGGRSPGGVGGASRGGMTGSGGTTEIGNTAGAGGADGGSGGAPMGGVPGDGGTGGQPGTGGMAGHYGRGTGGQPGTGGAENDPPTTGTLSGSCPVLGAYGCAGHAQKGQLICTGTWAANGNCAGSNNCDTTPGANAGSCQPIVTECLGKKPGDIVCQGMNRVTCGPDIVTVAPLETCAVIQSCLGGVCRS